MGEPTGKRAATRRLNEDPEEVPMPEVPTLKRSALAKHLASLIDLL